MIITALKAYEQKYRDVALQYPDTVKEQWIHGYLNCLESVNHPTVTLHIHSRINPKDKPYRVMWSASTDRKVNGQWKAVNIIRSRSFGKLDNAIKFIDA
jgi:hypothetical protein